MYWMQIRPIELNYVISLFIKVQINLFASFVAKYWHDCNVWSRRSIRFLTPDKTNGEIGDDFFVYEKRRMGWRFWWAISWIKTWWARLLVRNNKKLSSRLLRLKNIDIQNISKSWRYYKLKNVKNANWVVEYRTKRHDVVIRLREVKMMQPKKVNCLFELLKVKFLYFYFIFTKNQ
jgi:hypothetical protein